MLAGVSACCQIGGQFLRPCSVFCGHHNNVAYFNAGLNHQKIFNEEDAILPTEVNA